MQNDLVGLEKLFEQRVASDNSEFGITSVYVPIPAICPSPTFCLIAMEGSVGNGGVDGTRHYVNLGYKNFLSSEEDFILHYCAYSFLCDGEFTYRVTDICKGAMTTKDAGLHQEARYKGWIRLLEEELCLLGKPITIAIGKVPTRYLGQYSCKPDHSILHYSWNNSRWIKKSALELDQVDNWDGIEEQLLPFSRELMIRCGYSEEMIGLRLDNRFHRPLPTWKKALLTVYKNRFTEIRSNSNFR